nr:serine/threonine protein kinase SRPK1 [Tanacetum cinerariifolium]
MKETLYELLKDEQKKQLGKNNEAKMTIYNALPHPNYSSKNHIRKFLRALPLNWRAKVPAIEEAKDFYTVLLDDLVGNLKVYEMILENNGVVSKTTTKDKVKSIALKAKITREQTSDNSDSQDGSNEDADEEEKVKAFNLLARNFYKFFRKGKLHTPLTYSPHKTHCHLGNLEKAHWAGEQDKDSRVWIVLIEGQGSLMDKIICDLNKTPDLSQRPPQNCLKCGNLVDGHYCQGCALLRNKFKKNLFTYCIKNGILQDSSEPSNDNTNVVNALQEPFVVKQYPDENSSQINHHCCYKCGDSLEDIFCHQCTCELCGRGAHYGYNYSPKVSVVSNPEPCHNQNVDELPQTVPSFDPTCYSEDGNPFTYDSTSNLVHESPNVFDPPMQSPIYSYEFYGNDVYYGHDCSLQFPVIHQPIREKTCTELLAEEHEANINTQPFKYSVVPQPPQEEISVEFLQEKRNQIDYVKTFLRKFNRIYFYEMPKVLSLAWETITKIELAFEDKHCQPEDILELHNDVQNIHEELAVYINTPN